MGQKFTGDRASIIAQAQRIANAPEAITYPSMVGSQQVRDAMKALLTLVTDETPLAKPDEYRIEAVERHGGFHGFLRLQQDGCGTLVQGEEGATNMTFAEAWCVLRFAHEGDRGMFPRYELIMVPVKSE